MKNLILTILLNLTCFSLQAATLESAFYLGEQQEPTLDKLLPDVARHIAFSQDSKKLVVKTMAGTVVEWNIQTQEKRELGHLSAKRWFAYAPATEALLIRDTDDNIALLSLKNGTQTPLTHGAYENGSISLDGTRALLSKGDDTFEVWRVSYQGATDQISAQQLKTLLTQLPIRNGLTLSDNAQFIAAAEGTYRAGEGHRTLIEIWNATDKQPIKIFNTGEILAVWNLRFSPDATLLAVDTQHNAQSGIRVWEIPTGQQRLAKSGFDAYWTRALAFSPASDYLASGDEAGNLRIWDLSEAESITWETYPTGIQALAFSPDHQYLAVALWNATIHILHWRHNDE